MKWNVGRGEAVGMKGFWHSNQWLFAAILVSATICAVSAFILAIDTYVLASAPETQLACDINEVISCGKVALSWQANAFGFPNVLIGLVTEPVVMTIAVAGLSGVKFPRWFMFVAQLAYLFGLSFALWLFYQSAFVINSLCPYCLLIAIFTSVTFFTLLHYNIREDNLFLPAKVQAFAEELVRLRFTEIAALFLVGLIITIIFAIHGLGVFGL